MSLWTDEDEMVDIVSYHNMLMFECKLYGREERNAKVKKEKVEVKGCRMGNILVDLSKRRWEHESLHVLGELIDIFC